MLTPSKDFERPSSYAKGNPLAELVERALRVLIANKQTFFSVGVTLGVALGLATLVVYRQKEFYERTWEMLSVAQNQVFQGQMNPAVSTLKDLTSRFPAGPATEHADYLLGNLYMAMQNPAAAADAYNNALKNPSNPNLKPLMLNSLGNAYEDEEQTAKAIDAYRQFIKEYPEHFLTPRVLFNLVRLESRTNIDQAKDSYEKLLTLYPNTPWTKRAGTYIQAAAPKPAK